MLLHWTSRHEMLLRGRLTSALSPNSLETNNDSHGYFHFRPWRRILTVFAEKRLHGWAGEMTKGQAMAREEIPRLAGVAVG